MRINTNLSSLNTQNYLRISQGNLEKSMGRLSSGLRINSAADDAAGLAVSTRMDAAVRGMDVAKRNAQDGISLIQTGESAMGTITSILQRVRELAVQADNGTNNTEDLASLQDELDELVKEIDHIADNTEFNGIKLLNASDSVDLHISNLESDTVSVSTFDVTASALSVNSLTLDGNAQDAISLIDAALDTVSGNRAELGAMQSRLNFVIDNLNVNQTNVASAKSRITDADMATEMSNLTKNRVITQSAIAMLSQANQQPQAVLQLLQG